MSSSIVRRKRWHLSRLAAIFALTLSSAAVGNFTTGCSIVKEGSQPVAAVSFADYQRGTLSYIRARRSFQHTDRDAELAWNGPQEWSPSDARKGAKPDKGILFVHGLGDSPWSFHDLAQVLAEQGFLVRTLLLPGHGTRPEDLLDATLQQWQQVVQEQAQTLQQEVDQVFLGGFSTGANLVMEYAYANPEIAGLVLFSPGFKGSSLDWLAPIAALVRPWLLAPPGTVPMQNAVRYLNVPTNGFTQFYRSSVAARHWLRTQAYDKPVFMAVAQHDSVLDTDYLLDVFQRRFTHPASRLIWYGAKPAGLIDTHRILIRDDRLPEQRISQFSHMGLLFSPTNPLYGDQGWLRICSNGQDEQAMRACEQGASVWFSDWGYREDDKIHARLTFNPYFDWQASVMATVLDGRMSGWERPKGQTP